MGTIIMNGGTFRLFKKEPSFMDGVASIVDLSPNQSRYNYDLNEKEADINSLQEDWRVIGNDLWNTMKNYEHKSKQISIAG